MHADERIMKFFHYGCMVLIYVSQLWTIRAETETGIDTHADIDVEHCINYESFSFINVVFKITTLGSLGIFQSYQDQRQHTQMASAQGSHWLAEFDKLSAICDPPF